MRLPFSVFGLLKELNDYIFLYPADSRDYKKGATKSLLTIVITLLAGKGHYHNSFCHEFDHPFL